MPINQLDFVVLDIETGGLDREKSPVLSIAAKAYNCRTLEPYPEGEFQSLIRPEIPYGELDPQAMAINGLKEDELAAAPLAKVVWPKFVDWVRQWRKTKASSEAPIAAGKNIRNFDLKFLAVLNAKYGKTDVIFNSRVQLDLEDFLFSWFESDATLPSYRMDDARPYFNLTGEGGHTAIVDVRQTGLLLMAMLKLHRKVHPKVNWKAVVA